MKNLRWRGLVAFTTILLAVANIVPARAQTVIGTPQQVYLNRYNAVLTTANLGVSGVYDSAWMDNNTTPTLRVNVASYANQASAAAGFIVQQSNDTSNANLTNTAASTTCAASTLCVLNANVSQRYWRVQYTNTTTAQTSFEVALAGDQVIGANVDTSGNYTVNATLWNGTTLGSPTAVGTTGSGNVITANTVLNAATVGAMSSTLTANLAATVTSIKASAGTLYGLYAVQTAAAACYVEVWNTASGSVTLGTTVPTQVLYVGTTAGTYTLPIPAIGVAQGTAISIAGVTAYNGSSGCATGVEVVALWK